MNMFVGLFLLINFIPSNINGQYYGQQAPTYYRMASNPTSFHQPQQFFAQPQQQQFFVPQQQQHTAFARQAPPETIQAIAKIEGNVTGLVNFAQMPGGPTQVSGRITGLERGDHGFHIHQSGDTREGCKSMGGHYNPEGNSHGAPTDRFRHAGDLGNIVANDDGVAEFNFIDPQISLFGPLSIMGRGVVVHAKQDDLGRGTTEDSRKTGNAGGRVGCGIVAVVAK